MSDRAPEPIRARLGPTHADLGLPDLVVDGAADGASLTRLDDARALLRQADELRRVLLLPPLAGAADREVVVDGWRIAVEVEPERHAGLRERASRGRSRSGAGGPTEVRAVIPGRVLSVAVGVGDVVTAGQPMLIIEAMKMQNELRTPRDGTVQRVAVGPGQTIDLGDVLVVLA